jgi:HK97 gp10 family phage protein
MEVKATVNLNGIDDALKQLGKKLARKALRKALKPVGEMWVSEMKSRAPVLDGDLRDSIGSKITSKSNKDGLSATVSVGPMYGVSPRKPGDSTQQPAVYAQFVEFGTKNMKREPFARPTFDATADKAVEIFVDALRGDLKDIIKS